jgi:hypothetical protein
MTFYVRDTIEAVIVLTVTTGVSFYIFVEFLLH